MNCSWAFLNSNFFSEIKAALHLTCLTVFSKDSSTLAPLEATDSDRSRASSTRSLLRRNYVGKKRKKVCIIKFSFSEKATKIWKNLPLVLTLLSKNNYFVKTSGRFFQILWPSHNVLTLTEVTNVITLIGWNTKVHHLKY